MQGDCHSYHICRSFKGYYLKSLFHSSFRSSRLGFGFQTSERRQLFYLERAITLALNSKNKLGFVDNSITAPSKETDPDGYATWSRCNDMVHSWIVNALSSKISDSVIYYSTAHEVWEDLRERFSQSNAPHIFEIQRDIAYLRQEQLSVSIYYTKLKGLWDELASYNDAILGAQQD
ncbi:hypothetical protein LWI28_018372 [Acer negundo]|uniref:Retrotransposon gag domain-containing protein n=1 Tax=Acer negundo TaxID=4023 RepID=A0AAD5NK00_ACENE|nr:hypothetical protein LWI28_018372 [Acer negundo]